MTDGKSPKKARASEEALRPAIETARGVTQDIGQSGEGVQESSEVLNLEVSVRRAREAEKTPEHKVVECSLGL